MNLYLQEKIESIAVNLKSSGELEESEELQLQLQEIQDMVSIKKIYRGQKCHSQIFLELNYTVVNYQLLSIIAVASRKRDCKTNTRSNGSAWKSIDSN